MTAYLRVLDRILIHLYYLAGLGIAFTFLVDEVAYNHAAFAMLKLQAEALLTIAKELSGVST